MKIAQIALRNFRSSQNVVLDTDAARVYVCGLNGVGKSSIRDGIRWALRGVCAGTDLKGGGWEELQPEGTAALAVGLNLAGVGTVERYRDQASYTLSLEGRDNDRPSTQEAIYTVLNTTPEFLDAVLETDFFLRLHHAETKSFVLGLLNVRIKVGEELLPLNQVDARYDKAFKDRTTAKALLKAHAVPPFTMPEAGPWPPTADIQAKLTGLREELKAAIGTSSETAGRRKLLEQQLAEATARPVRDVPADGRVEMARWQQEVTRLEAEADRIAKALESATPKGKQPAAAPTDVEGLCQTLTAHQPTKGCVLDPEVPCKTAKIIFTNRVKFLRSQEPPPPEPAPLRPVVPAFDASLLAEARAQLRLWQDRVREHDTAERVNAQRQDEIDALTAQLSSLGPASPAGDTTAVEALQARIAKGEKVLETAREFWRAKDAHETALARKKALEADVERLEALVDVLGPKGARVQALGEAIGAFEAAINRVTETFGWTVKFELDPWMVRVNGRRLHTYSESQQFRIGIAVQVAVAAASGLRFLVVDRIDMLDLATRAAVNGMLMADNPNLDQVFVLATREPSQALPSLPATKAYRLGMNGNGRTAVLEATPSE